MRGDRDPLAVSITNGPAPSPATAAALLASVEKDSPTQLPPQTAECPQTAADGHACRAPLQQRERRCVLGSINHPHGRAGTRGQTSGRRTRRCPQVKRASSPSVKEGSEFLADTGSFIATGVEFLGMRLQGIARIRDRLGRLRAMNSAPSPHSCDQDVGARQRPTPRRYSARRADVDAAKAEQHRTGNVAFAQNAARSTPWLRCCKRCNAHERNPPHCTSSSSTAARPSTRATEKSCSLPSRQWSRTPTTSSPRRLGENINTPSLFRLTGPLRRVVRARAPASETWRQILGANLVARKTGWRA
jgi:hypothetical protein